jgi:SAM-dependent methyltransferase
MLQLMRRWLGKGRAFLFDKFGLHVAVHRRRPTWAADNDRTSYQRRYVQFDYREGDRVLDVGSGGQPFPHATVLTDRFLGRPTRRFTRSEPLVTSNKPFVLADIHHLPFLDKAFDYVYCAHVLEVIDDPMRACRELIRVGKKGFIEAPTAAKDMLFAWGRNVQQWHLVAIERTLCFFEYSERQLDGVRSTLWRDYIFSRRHHPLQDVFYHNQDVFNVMFSWTDSFSIVVFRLDGTIETHNIELGDAHLHPTASARKPLRLMTR